METKELRQGNIVCSINRRGQVHLPVYSYPFEVVELLAFKTRCVKLDLNPAEVEQWTEFNNSDISPIPLTEDWLIKFGFALYCGDYEKMGVRIGEHEEWEGETIFKFSIDEIIFFNSIEIKYVHQLQNLFFALVGEELSYS